ncbi:MAG: hypothetical protein ACRD2R_02990 [Terriglobales bacterium]
MYRGTLIDELIASVERAEEHARMEAARPRELEVFVPRFYEASRREEMIGVA